MPPVGKISRLTSRRFATNLAAMKPAPLSHRQVIDALGGPTALARALEIQAVSTVRYWHRRDSIPAWWFVAISEIAAANGVRGIDLESLAHSVTRGRTAA